MLYINSRKENNQKLEYNLPYSDTANVLEVSEKGSYSSFFVTG